MSKSATITTFCRQGRRRFVEFLFALIGGMTFLTGMHGGAVAGAADATTPEAPAVTTATVQTFLKQTNESATLSNDVKAKAVEVGNQALEQLRLANEWAAKADQFESAQREAPERLKAIEEELKKPEPDLPTTDSVEDLSLEEIREKLAPVQAETKLWTDRLSEVSKEEKRRSERRVELPKLIADARGRLESEQKNLGVSPIPGEPAEITNAKQLFARARIQELAQELRAYQAELASYEARGTLLTARRDQAARNQAASQELQAFWEQILRREQAAQARRAEKQAETAHREAVASSAPLAIRRLAADNEALAGRRTGKEGLLAKTAKAEKDEAQVEASLAEIRSDFLTIQARVKKVGRTNAIGALLRRHRDKLPSLRQLRSDDRKRSRELAGAEIELIDLKAQRNSIVPINREAQRLKDAMPQPVSADIETSLTQLLQTKKDNLDALIRDYDEYIQALANLDGSELEFRRLAESVRAYVNENILWIKSTPPLRISSISESVEAAGWLLRPTAWFGKTSENRLGVFPAIVQDFLLSPLTYILFAVFFGLLLLLRKRMNRAIDRWGQSSDPTSSGPGMFEVLLLSVLTAAIWPLLPWFFDSRLSAPDMTGISPFTRAAAIGLNSVFFYWLGAELIRQICRPRGLAEFYLGWPTSVTERLRSNVVWLAVVLIPTIFAVRILESEGGDVRFNSLGRLVFIAQMALAATFFGRVFHRPDRGLFGSKSREPGGQVEHARSLGLVFGMGIPLALAAMSAVGYHYSALEVARGLITSVWIVAAVVIAAAVIEKFLIGVHAKQLERQGTSKTEFVREGRGLSAADASIKQERMADLLSAPQQIHRLVWAFASFLLLLGMWQVWHDLLPALGILKRVELWSYMSETTERVVDSTGVETLQRVPVLAQVTLAHILLAILIVVMVFIAARNMPGLLEVTVLQRLPLEAAVRFGITTVFRYLLVLLGLLYAAQIVGLSWSRLQWLVAGVGVGLGFGLQEIFANFISGLIILFERPIRVGDIVTVSDVSGTVTRIQIRATTIVDWDRKELIVPNKSFITGNLVNWTLTDKTTRVTVSVGIAYGSDTDKAHKILLKIARDHPLVLKDPPPRAVFMAFGDSTLNFNLYVHIPHRDYYYRVVDEINTSIDKEFKEAGIEIAFPQRDLHLRSADIPFPVMLDRGEGPEA